MRDTKIMIAGMPAMVEAAHAPYFLKKQSLVAQARELQKALNTNPKATVLAHELGRVMGKIIRLNRTIKSKGMHCHFIQQNASKAA